MKKMDRKKMKAVWFPLNRAELTRDIPEPMKTEIGAHEIWKNNIYTVFVKRNVKALTPDGLPLVTWLSIKRNDKQPAKDWRHFQLIKNQLCGAECDGIEIYPKESRLVDAANQFHLWVLEDLTEMIPFGWNDGRQVMEDPLPNSKQRQRFYNT